ncbi:hypothetical protein [Streptomyces sp. NPDC006638]|uniref:hypothetical protein n=1 Tax=unclassified Streptomyces TaxID=2593676 RepID=UPI0033AE0FFC
MTSQGASVTAPCGACGGVLTRTVGQRVDQDEVRWETETACTGCRAGGSTPPTAGTTPEDIRHLLLTAHGPARLTLTDGTANLISVTRVLSRTRGLSLPEARSQAAELRTTGLLGTLVEMEHLATAFRARAVPVTVTPATAG